MRVLVTRPQPQAGEWVLRLAALGVPACALPLLDIAPAADPAPVQAAWSDLAQQDLAMFVSPSAVVRFFEARPADQAWPEGLVAGCTGPGTHAALRKAGVPEACIVSPPVAQGQFDSEALWALLRGRRDWRGARALIVRGEGGREWLADTLRAQGAQPRFVEAYRRATPQLDAGARALLAAALAEPAGHLWLFSSSEAVRQLPALAPDADWSASRALATHPRIAEAARALGFARVDEVEVTPEAVAARLTPSIQSLRP